jgi:hypothetical protein
MAVSGTISTTTFNTRKVIDHAYRRCRLNAQAITAEMIDYAQDALYLLLSEMANVKTASWCVERQIYPFYEGQYTIPLDVGTIEVLNANLRTLQELDPGLDNTVITATSYTYDFNTLDGNTATVNTVGIKWSAAAVTLTFAVSADDSTWTNVGTQTTTAAAGAWTWTDIVPAYAYRYFRISSTSTISATEIYLGTMPQEIPMGVLNRDTYVAQSNKVFQGRPLTYWYQRDRVNPLLQVWPAPNAAAEVQQLIVWRSRHIMDVGTMAQEVEVPQRWMEAIVSMLAAKVALETPMVDLAIIPLLDQKAAQAYALALAGDNSGAPTFINPYISPYTR